MAYIGTQPKDIRSFGKAKFDFTATQGQTVFTGSDDDGKTLGYTTGQITVYLNGILLDESDYTASGSNTITLASAANAGDILSVVALQTDIPNSDYVPATGGTFSGAVVANDGLTINNNAATVLTVDRATSDGSLVDFKKDGTSVGSVGTQGGDKLTVGNAAVGVAFNNTLGVESIYPWNLTTNDARDAAVDIGYPTVRFKNLYLSGGVYLGGTGAANLLDDYEEGTWTPSFVNMGTGTYSVQAGTYIKVGSLVYIMAHLDIASVGTASGYLFVTGLPFSVDSTNINYGISSSVHGTGWTTARTSMSGLGLGGQNTVNFYYDMSSSGVYAASHADLGTGNLLFSMSYKTP